MNKNVVSRLGGWLAAVALIAGLTSIAIFRPNPSQVSAASPNDVIINELMYNPSTGDQNDEYIELYNTTGSSIDLTGWSFTAGITLTFGSVSIPANDYIVISPSISNTLTTYGVVSSAQYTGNLSNGGETITLTDNLANEISTVGYDDAAPWPLTPDGTGPSMELKATNLDNTLAVNWGASTVSGGTPLAVNSLVGLSLPVITGVNDPNNVAATTAVNITATVTGSTNVILKYKTAFNADTTLTMFDDGAHNDGAAADDQYGATIPGQAIKTLVRFKVEATNGSGTSSSPGIDDSMNYNGYYVKDPSVTSAAPILEWFIPEAEYQDMYDDANLLITDQHEAVIVYGNEVYDNSSVRVKGSNTLQAFKKSIKVDLPTGHTLTYPGITTAIKEFHLNANAYSQNAAKVPTVQWAMKQAGLSSPDTELTQVQRNGEFEGAFLMIDKYQSSWREANGYSSGQMYGEVDSGHSDTVDLDDWFTNLDLDRKDTAKREYILDNNNIPALSNYMAMAAITTHMDFSRNQNIAYYRAGQTQRWEVLPWDHDGDLVYPGSRNVINAYDMQDTQSIISRTSLTSLYEQADLRSAYLRRLSTLVDRFYTNDGLLNKYNELTALYADLSAADALKWGDPNRRTAETDIMAINNLKLLFGAYYRDPWALPPAQTNTDRQSVSIAQVVADANNADEFVRLDNSADTPVDISDWVLDEINYTIPAGSVIPANSSIYILRDDLGYRASHASVLVAGQYGTDLGGSGTLTLLTDANVEIDDYAY